jgi:hypothetical protein
MISGVRPVIVALLIFVLQDGASFVAPRILTSEGSPVTLNAAKLAVEGDRPVAALCSLTTQAEDTAYHLGFLVVVYDVEGRRKDERLVELSRGDVADDQAREWSVTVPLSGVGLRTEDQLVLGLKEVDTERSGHWSAENLVDTADREFGRTLKSMSVVVVAREDAPAAITRADLLEAPPAPPVGIRVVLSNPKTTAVFGFTLTWYLFDGKGLLRAGGSHSSAVGLFPQSETVVDVRVSSIGRTSSDRWIGVVCLSRSEAATGEWKRRCTAEEARGAIWEKPGRKDSPRDTGAR